MPEKTNLSQRNEELQQRIAALSKAGEAGKAERQRFNDLLKTLPAYLILLTPDYHVPFANRFFRERFGAPHVPASVPAGSGIDILFHLT